MDNVEGLIGYFEMSEWWFSSFSEQERKYIDNHFQPMGSRAHSLTQGKVLEYSQPAPEFLNSLKTWFSNKKDSSIAERIHLQLSAYAKDHPINKPGYLNGRHFTTYVADVNDLVKQGNLIEAEKLLLQVIDTIEQESKIKGWIVAPWYYDKIALVYRKQKKFAEEIEILERFSSQNHGNTARGRKILERLEKNKTNKIIAELD
jgi:hypothetical protein